MIAIRENLLLQFSIVSFVLIALVVSLAVWGRKASVEAIVLEEASTDVIEVATRHISHQLAPGDFLGPMVGERYDAFNDYVQRYVVSDRIASVKLWNPAGQLIYSNDRSQIGRTFPIEADLAKALRGSVSREISEPQKAESEGERHLGALIEIYIPVRRPGSDEVIGVYEVYQFFAPYARQIAQHISNALLTVGMGAVVLYLTLCLIVRRGWNTILAQRREVDMRLREVTGLNNLFRLQMAERDRILEALHQLSEKEISLEALDREGLRAEYDRLRADVHHLAAEEASRPAEG